MNDIKLEGEDVNPMEKKNYDLTQITRVLLEIRDNCVPKDGEAYDDPKRMEKYDALKAAIDLINNPSQLVTGDTSDGYHTFNERMVVNSIVLTKLQKQKLEEHAAKLGIGVSALIRLAVSEWLEARADRA